MLLSGIGSLTGSGQWIMALIGYIGIIFVMFSGARRLEIRQNKNYGKDPEYQKYVRSVPILVPFNDLSDPLAALDPLVFPILFFHSSLLRPVVALILADVLQMIKQNRGFWDGPVGFSSHGKKQKLQPKGYSFYLVTRRGLEPRTFALKGRCSTN